jgi:hypothetical protein
MKQNVVIVLSFVNGIDIVAKEFVATIEAISNHTSLSSADEMAVEDYLNRLPLAPRYAFGDLAFGNMS